MPSLEVTTSYQVAEADLINVLKDAANSNQRHGYIEVSFTEGDYTGGNDAPIIVNLVMVESAAT